MGSLVDTLAEIHKWLFEQGLAEPEPKVESFPTPWLRVSGEPAISFCTNNYLGIAARQDVREMAVEAVRSHGLSTCESRRLGGNLAIIEMLEDRIASFKRAEAALVCATGLLTNVATIPAIITAPRFANHFHGRPDDSRAVSILFDERCHRSLRMGITLAGCQAERFRHSDIDALAHQLRAIPNGNQALIVMEGAYSMDGDLAPLREIGELARDHRAAVYLDDAHGTGVYGAGGRGVAEHFDIDGVDFQMGTFSKALGGMGGFVATRREVVQLLKLFASGYRFTSSLPAEQVAGLILALEILEREPELRRRLWENTARLRRGLDALGLSTGQGFGPIVPIMVGHHDRAREMETQLLRSGYFCAAITPPLVRAHECRLRVTVTAMHSEHDIDGFLTALESMARTLPVEVPSMGSDFLSWEDDPQIPAYVRRWTDT